MSLNSLDRIKVEKLWTCALCKVGYDDREISGQFFKYLFMLVEKNKKLDSVATLKSRWTKVRRDRYLVSIWPSIRLLVRPLTPLTLKVSAAIIGLFVSKAFSSSFPCSCWFVVATLQQLVSQRKLSGPGGSFPTPSEIYKNLLKMQEWSVPISD